MNIEIGKSQALVGAAQRIRQQVFVYEQGIPPALDRDGLDAIAHHVLVTDHNQAVATARLVIGDNGHGVIARVAVVPS
ncbi:GNAT family N-acetyltransferase [Gallaecimonas mangrovi]|uniref:GNAT family N-acetyltransferase n=1 Tax=Gallaecimonas mangrovi TaxID=2291597 RepID=UPI0030103D39